MHRCRIGVSPAALRGAMAFLHLLFAISVLASPDKMPKMPKGQLTVELDHFFVFFYVAS